MSVLYICAPNEMPVLYLLVIDKTGMKPSQLQFCAFCSHKNTGKGAPSTVRRSRGTHITPYDDDMNNERTLGFVVIMN